MRYLLLLYGEPVRPEALTPESWRSVAEAHADFTRELTEAGALGDSAPLAPPDAARVRLSAAARRRGLDRGSPRPRAPCRFRPRPFVIATTTHLPKEEST